MIAALQSVSYKFNSMRACDGWSATNLRMCCTCPQNQALRSSVVFPFSPGKWHKFSLLFKLGPSRTPCQRMTLLAHSKTGLEFSIKVAFGSSSWISSRYEICGNTHCRGLFATSIWRSASTPVSSLAFGLRCRLFFRPFRGQYQLSHDWIGGFPLSIACRMQRPMLPSRAVIWWLVFIPAHLKNDSNVVLPHFGMPTLMMGFGNDKFRARSTSVRAISAWKHAWSCTFSTVVLF